MTPRIGYVDLAEASFSVFFVSKMLPPDLASTWGKMCFLFLKCQQGDKIGKNHCLSRRFVSKWYLKSKKKAGE